ncbi:MAG: hypothetical protein ACI8UD_000191 [Planctomycetota bacterium]|jgi:hypothetical protein
MTTVVTALFRDLPSVDSVVDKLVAAGFEPKTINIIAENTSNREDLLKEETDDSERGIVTGAVTGGILATLGFGAMTMSGFGIVIAGPLVMSLAAGAAGTVAGGLVGALTGHGVSSMTAQSYETSIRNGSILVAVHTTHGQLKRASKTLQQSGGEQVSDSVHRDPTMDAS